MYCNEKDVSRDKTGCHSKNGDTLYIEDLDSSDFRVVAEYRSILRHLHELPRGTIERDNASSEPDLEWLRDVYFEHLKDTTSNLPTQPPTWSGTCIPVLEI